MSIEKIGVLAIELQAKIDARNNAKANRKKLLCAYTEETGEYYDYYSHEHNGEKEPLIDDAHAAVKVLTKELSTARSKLRREIRKVHPKQAAAIAESNQIAASPEGK